jgi:putative hydrolase of the HAD superfamily
MPEPFDAVLLDLYDTIVWSEWARLRDLIASQARVDERALLKAFDQTRPARGVGAYADAAADLRAVLEAAGVDPTPERVGGLAKMERTELESGVHLYDDVFPALATLQEAGVRTALVSNCSHSTRPIVDRLGLEGVFDAVILSFEVGAMKPDPSIYRTALERLGGIAPGQAVFVDDQPDYCDGAAAVGLATRLMLRPEDRSFESLVAGPGAPPVATHGHEVVTDLRWLM